MQLIFISDYCVWRLLTFSISSYIYISIVYNKEYCAITMLTGDNFVTEPVMITMCSDSPQASKSHGINIRGISSPLPGMSLSSPMTRLGHSPQRAQRVSSQFMFMLPHLQGHKSINLRKYDGGQAYLIYIHPVSVIFLPLASKITLTTNVLKW